MTHWFDQMTKGLAEMFTTGSLGPVVPIGPTRPVDLCGRRRTENGALEIREVSLTHDAVTFNRRLSFDRAAKAGHLSATVKKGQTVVVQLDMAATKDGSVSYTATYGPDVQGAKNVTMTSKNGRVFQGSFDGRAFSYNVSLRTPLVTFVDGKPAPKLVLDLKLSSTVTSLAVEVGNSFTRCGSAVAVASRLALEIKDSMASSGTATSSLFVMQPEFNMRPRLSDNTSPGRDWYEPASEDHTSCLACEDKCNQTFNDEAKSWECILSLGACYPVDLAEWVGCMALCNLPGGGCLPVPCGSFQTCGTADTCFNHEGGSLCCPAPAAVCQNVE